jgi:hypothetical protein
MCGAPSIYRRRTLSTLSDPSLMWRARGRRTRRECASPTDQGQFDPAPASARMRASPQSNSTRSHRTTSRSTASAAGSARLSQPCSSRCRPRPRCRGSSLARARNASAETLALMRDHAWRYRILPVWGKGTRSVRRVRSLRARRPRRCERRAWARLRHRGGGVSKEQAPPIPLSAGARSSASPSAPTAPSLAVIARSAAGRGSEDGAHCARDDRREASPATTPTPRRLRCLIGPRTSRAWPLSGRD